MHAFIKFITGPLFWISLLICFAGIAFRLFSLYRQARRKEDFIFTFLSPWYGMRSILVWLVPFMPRSTRISPVFWGATYIFHLCLFIAPLFLLAHVVLLEEGVGLSWITLSDPVADILTVLVLAALIFFIVRRNTVPEVKFLTERADYVFIGLVILPFLTGFIAYHQLFAYQWMMIIHILSGELMLVLIPFTRFFHMILAPITRAYTGSEFGGVRRSRDW